MCIHDYTLQVSHNITRVYSETEYIPFKSIWASVDLDYSTVTISAL